MGMVPIFAGCAEPLGALLSLFVLRAFVTEQLVRDLLAMVAGVMCYLALGELLPEAARTGCWGAVAAGFSSGALVMVLTHSRDDKDPYEASNQGWEERGVRQDDDGEGEASEDGREGLLRGCSEECGLSWWGDEVCVGLLRCLGAV